MKAGRRKSIPVASRIVGRSSAAIMDRSMSEVLNSSRCRQGEQDSVGKAISARGKY